MPVPFHDCTPRTVRGHDEWGPTTTVTVPRCDRGLNSHREPPEPPTGICYGCAQEIAGCECRAPHARDRTGEAA